MEPHKLSKRKELRRIYGLKSLREQELTDIKDIILSQTTSSSGTMTDSFNFDQTQLSIEQLLKLIKQLVHGSKRGHPYINCKNGKIKDQIKNIFRLILVSGTKKGQQLYQNLQSNGFTQQIIERFFSSQVEEINALRQYNIELEGQISDKKIEVPKISPPKQKEGAQQSPFEKQSSFSRITQHIWNHFQDT